MFSLARETKTTAGGNNAVLLLRFRGFSDSVEGGSFVGKLFD